MKRRSLLSLTAATPALLLAACASTPTRGLTVSVAQVDVLPSAGSELRATVTLRIQNPNDSALRFDGATVDMALRGQTIGSGVTNTGGRVPGLGETLLPVTVTVTAVSAVRQAVGLYGADDRRLSYKISGALASSGMGAQRIAFEGMAELAFPGLAQR